MKRKKRLDHLLLERMPEYSRQQIQSWIMQGKVRVDGQVITKPGTQIAPELAIEINNEKPRYVSRAGFKLEKALEHFNVDVRDIIVLDAGLSTGGFTDCLLQHGAAKVYGIDVGYGQVHETIRNDPRVAVMERVNLRDLRTVGQPVDMVTLDLSFISILKVMDAVTAMLKPDGMLITLIKPQFEAGRHDIGRGGIVHDPQVHTRVIEEVTRGITSYGFTCKGVIPSPILGSTGNTEFLACFVRTT